MACEQPRMPYPRRGRHRCDNIVELVALSLSQKVLEKWIVGLLNRELINTDSILLDTDF